EVLDLRQEVDELVGDAADGLDLREVLLHAGGRFALDVVDVHHLVLDVEVELAPQEAAQVLVDEVVEGVPRSVVREVLLQERAVRVLLGGPRSVKLMPAMVKSSGLLE